MILYAFLTIATFGYNLFLANRRAEVIDWLGGLLPEFDLPLDSSDEELREYLIDGAALCYIAEKLMPGIQEGMWGGNASDQRSNVKKFLSVVAEMGLPGFSVKDLEEGSMSSIVECLLALKDNVTTGQNISNNSKTPLRRRLELRESDGPIVSVMTPRRSLKKERQKVHWDLKSPQRNILHSGQKVHDAFQLKRGSYTDLPAAKISEMMHSSSLDNAPTQSLLRVVNGILDESIERKRGEIPHRVVYLLRNVVQEIEHRIAIQADHIRNQNSIIKTREDKYRSKIKALETLVNGTNEENEITVDRLELIEVEKSKIDEKRKLGEQDMVRLMQEKENAENTIASLQQEIQILRHDLKGLVEAADNYHKVLAENQKLFNEVQELKGNIRVYCRVRPFLPGQDGKTSTVDYIGENGEILITNPFKQGKDICRMFKFNKVFTPRASQAEVFSDIQPLIRSVLDGFNVCIFAYGQTGSGKTYTMPNGLVVPDASLHPVKSTSDVLELMDIGQTNRAVGSTALNERSSRSHSILTVHVRGLDLKNGSTSRGCLHLIDLAGSERVERSEAIGDRLKEAQYINKSLSALGDVIFALAQKNAHVPYRNSKLTQVLQSSLGNVSYLKDTISRKDMEIEQLLKDKSKSPNSSTDRNDISQQIRRISGAAGSGEADYEDNVSDDGCSVAGTEYSVGGASEAAGEHMQKTPSRIARLFLTKNGQPTNSKPKSRESTLKPPGRTKSTGSQVTGGGPSVKPPMRR
nr:unnamed protein product [Digitaria exilis]